MLHERKTINKLKKVQVKKQVTACNHNIILKKEVIIRLFLLIIKLISSPQTKTGTGITMVIMSCKNYSYLNG